jgi:type II secretory pathway pseudopilin PulG
LDLDDFAVIQSFVTKPCSHFSFVNLETCFPEFSYPEDASTPKAAVLIARVKSLSEGQAKRKANQKTSSALLLVTSQNKMNYLKKINMRVRQRGTTLIELSVVIAVLLLLVGVLFIGITAWKNGANTAACIINLSSIQKAVRGYANMNQLNTAAALTTATLTSAGFWGTVPVCPAGGLYTPTGTVPTQGVAYMTCNFSGHAPTSANLANW